MVTIDTSSRVSSPTLKQPEAARVINDATRVHLAAFDLRHPLDRGRRTRASVTATVAITADDAIDSMKWVSRSMGA